MWTVTKKELLELSRDRKTLVFIVLLPLLIFPLLFGIAGFVAANQAAEEQEKVLKFAIVGEENVTEFAERLHFHKLFSRVTLAETDIEGIKQAINAQQLDFVLVVPESFDPLSRLDSSSEWQIFYNGASAINSVNQKFSAVLDEYTKQLRQAEMNNLGLDEPKQAAILEPIVLKRINTAPPREDIGEKIGGFIPYILLPLCLTGAMYAAIDLGAGEKERGTLETLLLSPVPYYVLVLGKFFAIMTGGLLTALITVLSLSFWGGIATTLVDLGPIKDALSGINSFELILILLLLLPVCAIFSALLLAISIYSRSYKEAQNYMGPLSIVVIVPIMFSLLPGVQLDSGWGWVPITNVALAMKELLKGTFDLVLFLPIFMSTAIIAGALLLFCVRWFGREDVLFR